MAHGKQFDCENIYWNYILLKESDWIILRLCDSQRKYLLNGEESLIYTK